MVRRYNSKEILPEADATGYPMTNPSTMNIMLFTEARNPNADGWLLYDKPELKAF